MRIERELMRGAGPVAVLRLLSAGEKYGYELVKMLELKSDGVLAMGQSTLYPMLYNLQAKGLVASRIDTSESRPRRYYRLTEKGKRHLERETQQWRALSVAMENWALPALEHQRDRQHSSRHHMGSTLARIRFTPLGDLLRGNVTGRLDWHSLIDSADLTPDIKALLKTVIGNTRLSRAQKADVAVDLLAHFTDGLAAGFTSDQIIKDYGDPQQSSRDIRTAKICNKLLARCFFHGTFVVAAALLLFYTGLTLWYYSGSPSPTVNYIAGMNRQIERTPLGERAWPIYQSVLFALHSKNGDPVLRYSADGKHWTRTARWIDDHQPVIESLRRASELPVLGIAFADAHSLADRIDLGSLPQVRGMRELADLLAFDSKRARERGDGRRLESDINALSNLAAQERDSGALRVNELVVLQLLNQSYDELDRTLVETPGLLDDAALIRLAHRISIPQTGSDLISLRGEVLLLHDALERSFTDSGQENGRLTPAGWHRYRASFAQSPSSVEQLLTQQPAAALLQPASLWVVASRRELLDEFQHIMCLNLAMLRDPLREADSNAPYEEQMALVSSTVSRVRYAPLLSLYPSLQRSAELAERTLGQRDGLLVGLALESYRRRNQHYPKTLASLTPDLLPKLIADRITGDPLKYRLIDGKPLVYSVGIDRIDDGGRLPMRNGQPVPSDAAQWGAIANVVSGDWVLYPKPRIASVAQMEN